MFPCDFSDPFSTRYSDEEITIMVYDIEQCKAMGVDGVVFGVFHYHAFLVVRMFVLRSADQSPIRNRSSP